MATCIADLPISSPFRIFDRNLGHYIFSILDTTEGGDVPPDIAFLPVDDVHTEGNVLIITTHTNN